MLCKCYVHLKISPLNVFFGFSYEFNNGSSNFLYWSPFNKCSPSNVAIVPLKAVLFELKISYTAFICLCCSPSKTLQCRRQCEGVSLTLQWSQFGVISKSILLLWLFNMQCPDFSLIIFEAPFLEVCLRCNARCFSSSLDIVGAMFLYLLSFVLFHLLCHLLRVIFLFSVFIFDDETM